MKKIIIAHHSYMTGDRYMEMMIEQFRKLITLNLYNACDKLYLGANEAPDRYPLNGAEWIRSVWKFTSGSAPETNSPKVEIVIYPDNKEEIRTLAWVRDYAAENPGDYVLYFHTKGITHFTEATESWREYMEYFVIQHWKDCVTKLDEGYDACGVLWNRDTVYGDYPHFSGGMWWANTDYINRLDHSFLTMDWRYAKEFWIGTGRDAKIFEFHNSRMNDIQCFHESRSHYSLPYPPENYHKNDFRKP